MKLQMHIENKEAHFYIIDVWVEPPSNSTSTALTVEPYPKAPPAQEMVVGWILRIKLYCTFYMFLKSQNSTHIYIQLLERTTLLQLFTYYVNGLQLNIDVSSI